MSYSLACVGADGRLCTLTAHQILQALEDLLESLRANPAIVAAIGRIKRLLVGGTRYALEDFDVLSEAHRLHRDHDRSARELHPPCRLQRRRPLVGARPLWLLPRARQGRRGDPRSGAPRSGRGRPGRLRRRRPPAGHPRRGRGRHRRGVPRARPRAPRRARPRARRDDARAPARDTRGRAQPRALAAQRGRALPRATGCGGLRRWSSSRPIPSGRRSCATRRRGSRLKAGSRGSENGA